MKGNQTLAGYDMVLGLSQNTINYQFQQLHRRNIIKKKWSVLMGNVLNPSEDAKAFHITGDPKDMKAKIDRWKALQDQISKARKQNRWSEIGSLIETLKKENLNFDLAWDVSLDPPKISIINQNTQSLSLSIIFKSGKLHYRPDDTSPVNSFDLKGCVYAFNVNIGQLKIDKDKMVMEAKGEMEQVIRDTGLSDHDFTIESLFLNFENARISVFDQVKSKFPKEATLQLQVAIVNYFGIMIKHSDNPYILGYGVTRRKLAASEKAMFQPTSLGFSTSYSNYKENQGKFSAFNFLMMLNKNPVPKDQNAGVLPKSLIEFGKDTSATTNGAFGIQNDHFKAYIKSMDSYVEGTFKDLEGVDTQGGFKDGVMVAAKHDKHKDDTIDSVYTVTRQPVKNNSDNSGISIRYKLEVSVTVKVMAFVIKVGEMTLSTSGQHTKGDINQKGAAGYLNFIVKTGKTGRFDLDHSLTEPVIAYDKNPNLFEGDFWKVFLNILTLIFSWSIQIINGIITQIAVDLGKDSAISNNEMLSKLRELDVLNQTNRVILPLGNIYTFKNLRYVSDNDIVAYDIAYAPVVDTKS